MSVFDFTATAPAVSPADSMAVSAIPPETTFAPEPAIAPQAEPQVQTSQECCAECISVYADSITKGGDNEQGQAIFDIVLNVSWTVGQGENCSYQSAKIVKSIAFDKMALFQQAAQGTPVTMVESKKAEAKKAEDNKKVLLKMRELAGIPGKGTFVH